MARLAHSLIKLRDEVNAAYPNRSKASDGWIGDAAHQAVASDHNPNAQGVVTALDITHSPQTGFDAHALANRLLANRNPNLKYLISNRRIAGDWTGWKWTPYNGSNPHDKHIHVSVGRGPDGKSTPPYDGAESWGVTTNNGGGMIMVDGNMLNNLYRAVFGRNPDPAANGWIGQPADLVLQKLLDSPEYSTRVAAIAAKDKAIADLNTKISELSSRPTKAELEALQAQIAQSQAAIDAANAKYEVEKQKAMELEQDKTESLKVGERFLQWIGSIFKKG